MVLQRSKDRLKMTLERKTKTLSLEQRQGIKKFTEFFVEDESGEQAQRYCFELKGGVIRIPLGLAPRLGMTVDPIHEIEPTPFTFRPGQLSLYDKALEQLRGPDTNTSFLELATATGKTCIAARLAQALGLRTVFLCFLDVVNRQTLGEFNRFTTLKSELVKKNSLDMECQVHIMGLRKAQNLWKRDPRVFDDVGFVIVDEAHLSHHFIFTELMFCFTPKALLGMSATPIWNDLTRMYFDDPIVQSATKPFVVRKIETSFVPDTSKKIYFQGRKRIDWTNAMTSLAENEDRNLFILNLIMELVGEHKLLVLCGRVAQCNFLHRVLLEKQVSCDVLVGRKKSYDQSSRVLVGGVKKIGVGFNDPTRTCLILCFDLSDVRQSEGRIRTTDNLVIDIVDCNHTLQKIHWPKREQWYLSRGATIVKVPCKNHTPSVWGGGSGVEELPDFRDALFGRQK